MAGSNKKSTTKGEAAAPVVIKDTKPLKKGKRKAKDDSETKVNLKKPKKKSDQKEIMKGFADSLGGIEAKVDLVATETDLRTILIPAKCENVPAMKPPAKAAKDSSSSSEHESSSDDEPGNSESISVEGFDTSVPVDDIKSALSKHFSSFGEITRVYVPTDRETGASLGYAYIDLKEGAKKALKLGEHDVGGWNLVVGKAEPIRSEGTWLFRGRCGNLGRCCYC